MTATVPTLAEVLGAFVAEFDLEQAPEKDRLLERARWHILDVIGLGFVAWIAEDAYATKLVASQGSVLDQGACTIIGSEVHAAAPVAAFVNGSLAHGWDFDDNDPLTGLHCEAFAVASTLAVAEEKGVNGLALAEAFVVTTEVAQRLAAGVVGSHKLNASGFHTTAVMGAFGAAAGAAKLMGLDAEQTANALALTASFASGTVQGWMDGSGRNKPIQPGWAAQSGITAARLAAADYTCSLTTIDGDEGLYFSHAWKEGWTKDPVLDGLGEHWRTFGLGLKLFPCGGMIQATAECVQDLVRENGIRAEEFEHGELVLPARWKFYLDQLGEHLYRPSSSYTSQGAVAVIAARIVLSGRHGVEYMTTQALSEPELFSLADKFAISTSTSKEDAELPLDEQPVNVALTTSRGTFHGQVRQWGGHPTRLNRERVQRKFRDNAGAVMDGTQAAEIEERVLGLDTLDNVRELTRLLGAPKSMAEGA